METLKGKIYECIRPYKPRYFYTPKNLEVEKGTLWEIEKVDLLRETINLKNIDGKSLLEKVSIHLNLWELHFKELDGSGKKEV